MSLKLTSLVLLSVAIGSGGPLTFTAAVRATSPKRITWSVEMRIHGSVKPAAVQWSFRYDPVTVQSVHVMASEAAAAAGKSVRCSNRSGLTTCLLWGPNQNQIPEGSIAVVNCNLTEHAATGFAYHIQDVSAASAKGESLPVDSDAAVSPTSRTAVWQSAPLFRRRLNRFLRIYRTEAIVAAAVVLFSTALLLLLAHALWRKSRIERKLRAI